MSDKITIDLNCLSPPYFDGRGGKPDQIAALMRSAEKFRGDTHICTPLVIGDADRSKACGKRGALRFKDKVAGVVNICGRKGGNSFTDTECEFIALLANHAAIAINTAGQFYQMKKGA